MQVQPFWIEVLVLPTILITILYLLTFAVKQLVFTAKSPHWPLALSPPPLYRRMKTSRKADIKGDKEARRKARVKALEQDEEDRSNQIKKERAAFKDEQPKHVAIEEQLHLNFPSATLDDSLLPGAAPRPSSVFDAPPLTPSGPMYLTGTAATHQGSVAQNIYLHGSIRSTISMTNDVPHPRDSAPQQGTAEQNIYLTGSIDKTEEVFPSTGSIDRSNNEDDLIDVAKQFVTVVRQRGGLTACVGASAIQALMASVRQEEIASKRLAANSLGG